MRSVAWSLGVMALLTAVVLHAQTTQQPDPKQTVTITGCVQNETDVLKSDARPRQMGMADEFVLTHSTVQTAGAAAQPPQTEPAAPAEPTGTAGSLGKIYRVTGDQEASLESQVGHKVEITGTFKDESDARRELGAIGTSGKPPATPAEPTTMNTPEITINAIKPVSDTCGG